MESLKDGVKANVLLLSNVELEDDIEDDVVVSPDLETIFCSSLSSLTKVEHDLDSLVRLSTVVELEDDIEDDIVEEEVSADLEMIFSFSSLA